MPGDSNYWVSISSAIDLLRELEERPQMNRHERLATATFKILDAIGQARSLARRELLRCVCPRCFRTYHLDVTLSGQPVDCLGCGQRWRAPEPLGRN